MDIGQNRPIVHSCYHFDTQIVRGVYEELIREGSRRRSDLPYRQVAASHATAMGQDGCRPNDGALFRSARHGFRKVEPATRLRWQADWTPREARLHQRKAVCKK